MKKNRVKKNILLVFLLLFFCLLLLSTSLLRVLQKEQAGVDISENNVISESENEQTIKDIIKKYDSKYISEGVDYVNVVLAKGLFEENGSSNENYIKSLMMDLVPFYTPGDFYIVDEEKELEIYARYSEENKGYEFVINKIENFYDKVDGKDFVKVDTTEIAHGNNFAITNYILEKLYLYEYELNEVAGSLGEGEELPNGYTSYQDGYIKLETFPNGTVRNIIFSDDKEEYITSRLSTKMSLRNIVETEPQYDFGSVEKGYIGYRQLFYYLFFYNDEVSAYSYSYKNNSTFEELLKEYLDTKDLDTFINRLTKKCKTYDSFKYDAEIKKAKILYSTMGVEINIEDNNPKGITFYNNYYLTDYIKSLVKTGVVSFEPDIDLIEKTEIERRKND